MKILISILLFWLGAFAYSRFSSGFPISSTITQKTDLFSVTGEGKVTVIPDTGIVDVGIVSQKPIVKSAQTEVNTVINKISDNLKNLGIKDKDIKTINYTVNPQYDYTSPTNKIVGYSVNTNLQITVRELDKINEVIDIATNNGANSVSGVQLIVEDSKRKELENDARNLAIKEAKTKAENLSKMSGMTLGKIVNIQEGSNASYPQPMMVRAGGGMMEAKSDTQIQPGSTDIVSNITLFYETR